MSAAAKRHRVYERDGHKCVRCSRTDDLTLDHIWPRSLGGSNHIDNLQTLCANCNRQKADRPPDDTPRPHLLRRKVLARIHSLSKGNRIVHSRDCHPVWGCVTSCPVQAALRTTNGPKRPLTALATPSHSTAVPSLGEHNNER